MNKKYLNRILVFIFVILWSILIKIPLAFCAIFYYNFKILLKILFKIFNKKKLCIDNNKFSISHTWKETLFYIKYINCG